MWHFSGNPAILPVAKDSPKEFESPTVHRLLQLPRGRLAQLAERCLHTAEVTGSSPVSPTQSIKGLSPLLVPDVHHHGQFVTQDINFGLCFLGCVRVIMQWHRQDIRD